MNCTFSKTQEPRRPRNPVRNPIEFISVKLKHRRFVSNSRFISMIKLKIDIPKLYRKDEERTNIKIEKVTVPEKQQQFNESIKRHYW